MNVKHWEDILDKIIVNPELHCRWLSTLSHLENCGARKIVAYEPYLETSLDVLQHAAEECRHAFLFKNYIRKVGQDPKATYPLLVEQRGKRYLHRLDSGISRILKNSGLNGVDLKQASYLLTTYCIEVRADKIYPLYEELLVKNSSSLSIKAIIKEEETHLKDIKSQIDANKKLQGFLEESLAWESKLFDYFSEQISQQVEKYLA